MSRRKTDKRGVPVDYAKIRQLRLRAGLTYQEAALRAGLRTKQDWYQVESGRRPNLGVPTLERIAAALGCRARDLLK